MKTTEIAAYIAERNPRFFCCGPVPFMPLLPVPESRTPQQVGWIAFQLCRQADPELQDKSVRVFFNAEIGAFGVFSTRFEMIHWEPVEWDGYGDLESWKEVAL